MRFSKMSRNFLKPLQKVFELAYRVIANMEVCTIYLFGTNIKPRIGKLFLTVKRRVYEVFKNIIQIAQTVAESFPFAMRNSFEIRTSRFSDVTIPVLLPSAVSSLRKQNLERLLSN